MTRKVANAFVNNFDNPNSFTRQMLEPKASLKFMNDVSGGRAGRVDIANKLKIGKGQIRQVLGMPRSSHPLARMTP